MVGVLAVLTDPATSIKSDVPAQATVGQSASAVKVALADFVSKTYSLDPPFDPAIMPVSYHPSGKQFLHLACSLAVYTFFFPRHQSSKEAIHLGL